MKEASIFWVLEEEGEVLRSERASFSKFGVSLLDLSIHRALGVNIHELQELSKPEAQEILAKKWKILTLDELPNGIDYLVFDSAVVCSGTTATNWLYLAYEQLCKFGSTQCSNLARREYLESLRRAGSVSRWLLHCDQEELREVLRRVVLLRRRRHRSEPGWEASFQSKTNRCNRVARRAVDSLRSWEITGASSA